MLFNFKQYYVNDQYDHTSKQIRIDTSYKKRLKIRNQIYDHLTVTLLDI